MWLMFILNVNAKKMFTYHLTPRGAHQVGMALVPRLSKEIWKCLYIELVDKYSLEDDKVDVLSVGWPFVRANESMQIPD